MASYNLGAWTPRKKISRVAARGLTKETNAHLERKIGQVELIERIKLRHDFCVHAFAEQTNNARREHLARQRHLENRLHAQKEFMDTTAESEGVYLEALCR